MMHFRGCVISWITLISQEDTPKIVLEFWNEDDYNMNRHKTIHVVVNHKPIQRCWMTWHEEPYWRIMLNILQLHVLLIQLVLSNLSQKCHYFKTTSLMYQRCIKSNRNISIQQTLRVELYIWVIRTSAASGA